MTRRTSLSAGSATSRRQTRTSSSCDVIGTDCCVLIVLMSLCHKQSCVSVSGVAAFVSEFLKWSNHLLLLHPFPLSCGVYISYRLHLTRFCTSSHDNSLSGKSFLMLSNPPSLRSSSPSFPWHLHNDTDIYKFYSLWLIMQIPPWLSNPNTVRVIPNLNVLSLLPLPVVWESAYFVDMSVAN